MNFKILRYETVDSTNTEAARLARQGADEGVCVIAERQSAGRGRQGRSWVSEAGSGLYFSIILRPRVAPGSTTLIPLMAGVAVHDLLLKCFLIQSDIKWPNDILVANKKICGILSDAVETPDGLAVILGIGINLRGEPTESATSIEKESSLTRSRDEVAESLLNRIERFYETFCSDPPSIVSEWQHRSTWFSGKLVKVMPCHSAGFIGVTDGLEANGALRVKMGDGSVQVIQAGDVEHVRSER